MLKRFLILVSILSMVMLLIGIQPSQADKPQPLVASANDLPPGVRKVPDEVLVEFQNMTVHEFLARTKGPVPHALRQFDDRPTVVLIEMEGEPLAQVYARNTQGGTGIMSAAAQQEYIRSLEAAQVPVALEVTAQGGQVIARYTRAYNGILAVVPGNRQATIAALPGVKAIHKAPLHYPALSHSVPLIQADQVRTRLGGTGDGIKIAIIDTGVDYTHAAFGGPGDPDIYAANDPTYITSTANHTETFPTTKVITGWDFAGTNYNPALNGITYTVPVSDADPLDERGHGTHVASIAAGLGVAGVISAGVAPSATIYAYKIFGKEGPTNLTISAIERAMDPNQDGDMSDHVDVINLSLGSEFGESDDQSATAVNNAAAIGIIVVCSAGNSGDVSYVGGSPASADSAIAVAASTTGWVGNPTINVSGTTYVTQTDVLYQPSDFADDTGHFTQTITATLSYVKHITTTGLVTLCSTSGITPNILAGEVALIQRGDCAFSKKVNNAAELGAIAAIIFNRPGESGTVVMGGEAVTIPAGFVVYTDGTNLAQAHGQKVVISSEEELTYKASDTPADSIATFSSRGPRGPDSALKPDVTAPGVNIVAAKMGRGMAGISYNGTSMAAPHVAGVAALLRQLHPKWTVEQVKAAIMNTAVAMVESYPLPLQGAGRVDAYKAAEATSVAIGDPGLVSLNWGFVPTTTDAYKSVKTITLYNFTNTKTYSTTWVFGGQSLTDGLSIEMPTTVQVGDGSEDSPVSTTVPITLSLDVTKVPVEYGTHEEYYGYVVLTNTAVSTDVLRLPFYVVPRPCTRLTWSYNAQPITTTVSITQSGPVSSSLGVYPLHIMDANEPAQIDSGDLRFAGMDYGWADSVYGDIIAVAINTWEGIHVPQPYVAEFDLYLDTDQDGNVDLIDFNYNLGAYYGGYGNNMWIVAQYNPQTRQVSLASPYLIKADFNSGLLEWYLPVSRNGLGGGDTDLEYWFHTWDRESNSDASETAYFDYSSPPFKWQMPSDPGPAARTATLEIVHSGGPAGYGVMLVDYNGEPGQGQAYYLPVYFNYLPVIFRNSP